MNAQSYVLFVQDEVEQTLVLQKSLDSAQVQKVLQSLVLQLQTEGYFEAKTISQKRFDDSIYCQIAKGKQLTIASIEILNIPKAWESRLRLDSLEYADNKLDSNLYWQTINRVLQFAANNGYPFAEISLNSYDVTEEGLSATFSFNKKYLFYFDELKLINEIRLNSSFLRYYLGIKEGDIYNEKLINQIKQKIDALSFVSLEGDPIIVFSDEFKAIVYLPLIQEKVSYLDGVLGLAPQSDVGNGTLITGEVEFRLRNPFGRGVSLDFSLQKFLENSQNFNLALNYPYLFASPLGVDVKLDMMRFDTTFFNFNYQIGLAYSFSANKKLKIFYERKSSNVLQDLDPRFGDLAQLNIDEYGLELYLNKLDYLPNPRSGYSFLLSYSIGDKNYTLPDKEKGSNMTNSFHVQNQLFIPIKAKSTIMLKSNSKLIIDSSFTENQAYRIGGFKDIRGFDENIFQASAFSLWGLAYRILPNRESFVEAFVEGGLIYISTNANEIQYPIGTGLGYSFKTGPGLFSISYAYGIQNLKNISLSRGRIHFGFSSYF